MHEAVATFLAIPTLESGTAKVGRVKFYHFRKNPVLRVPPRYWRCRALSVPATLVLSASNPREPRLPWSPTASLVGAIVGLMGCPLVRLGVPQRMTPAGCRLVVLCCFPHGIGCHMKDVTDGIPLDRSGHLLVLCLSAGRMLRRAGAAMSALDRSDAEQPILITRQAILEPRTVFVSLLRSSTVTTRRS